MSLKEEVKLFSNFDTKIVKSEIENIDSNVLEDFIHKNELLDNLKDKTLFKKIIIFLTLFSFIMVIVVLFWQANSGGYQLSDSVAIAFITTTFASILGLMHIILNNLFPNKK